MLLGCFQSPFEDPDFPTRLESGKSIPSCSAWLELLVPPHPRCGRHLVVLWDACRKRGTALLGELHGSQGEQDAASERFGVAATKKK